MPIMKWNPSKEVTKWGTFEDYPREIHRMWRDMDRMFDSFFRGQDFEETEHKVSRWSPNVEIAESGDAFVVKAELPGVSKNDVKVSLRDNLLIMRGEKRQEKDEKKASYHRVEREYGAFERSFTLPSTVKSDKIEATFKDGVLTLTLPKVEEAKPKEIEVKVE
jgi:HSP20 family protein